MEYPKQIIIVRKDIVMSPEKMSAQVAHASIGAILAHKQFSFKDLVIELTDAMEDWFSNSFTKIIVYAEDIDHLLTLKKELEDVGLVTKVIEDNGWSEFKEKCPNCKGKGYEFIPTDESGANSVKETCSTCDGRKTVAVPTITCLGVEPTYPSIIDPITGKLPTRKKK